MGLVSRVRRLRLREVLEEPHKLHDAIPEHPQHHGHRYGIGAPKPMATLPNRRAGSRAWPLGLPGSQRDGQNRLLQSQRSSGRPRDSSPAQTPQNPSGVRPRRHPRFAPVVPFRSPWSCPFRRFQVRLPRCCPPPEAIRGRGPAYSRIPCFPLNGAYTVPDPAKPTGCNPWASRFVWPHFWGRIAAETAFMRSS